MEPYGPKVILITDLAEGRKYIVVCLPDCLNGSSQPLYNGWVNDKFAV